MDQVQHLPQEFDVFTPEASRQKADALLRRALTGIRSAVEACLHSAAEKQLPAKKVRVGDRAFPVPEIACPDFASALGLAMKTIAGPSMLWGLRRSEVTNEAIAQYPQVFAALYAWGYLYPQQAWEDVIRWEDSPKETAENASEVLQVFIGFLHGTEGSGIRFRSGGSALCFDSSYQGRIAEVMAACMQITVQELCRLDRMTVVNALLRTHPALKRLCEDPRKVLEAMVEVVQQGEHLG